MAEKMTRESFLNSIVAAVIAASDTDDVFDVRPLQAVLDYGPTRHILMDLFNGAAAGEALDIAAFDEALAKLEADRRAKCNLAGHPEITQLFAKEA